MRGDSVGHQVSVTSQAVAGALDAHNDGMVKEAVQQGCGDDGVAKDLTPFREISI